MCDDYEVLVGAVSAKHCEGKVTKLIRCVCCGERIIKTMSEPVIIQGGMGAGVSNWRLAQAVSRTGQLGLVSGTALDQILARRLQDGDEGGHMRRGLDGFPDRAMAERIWVSYFIPGGKGERTPYKPVPMLAKEMPRELVELCIVANFVEV